MPEISRFLGMIIAMYYKDHNLPHFHVRHNEYKATISIKNLALLNGKLPPKVLGLAIEWASLHQEELMQDWGLYTPHFKNWFLVSIFFRLTKRSIS